MRSAPRADGLFTDRACVLRVARARTRGQGKAFIVPEIMISEQPAGSGWTGRCTVTGKEISSCGLGSSAISTLVERTTRFTMLLHLPRMARHGVDAGLKNGPALAGHGAEAVRDSITGTITSLPEQLRRSLTWDQGSEMSQHAWLKIDTGLDVYFWRPALAVAAWHEREYKWAASSVFPERHRPEHLQHRCS